MSCAVPTVGCLQRQPFLFRNLRNDVIDFRLYLLELDFDLRLSVMGNAKLQNNTTTVNIASRQHPTAVVNENPAHNFRSHNIQGNVAGCRTESNCGSGRDVEMGRCVDGAPRQTMRGATRSSLSRSRIRAPKLTIRRSSLEPPLTILPPPLRAPCRRRGEGNGAQFKPRTNRTVRGDQQFMLVRARKSTF